MRDPIRHFAAEFVGTFALVFVGGGAIFLTLIPGANIGLVTVALAHGLILGVMITATMRISGHLNPAVTFGFMVTRRIEPMMAGVYLMAQLLGAIAAAYLHKLLIPAQLYQDALGGIQTVASTVTSTQAYFLEAIGTFFLVFVVFGTAVDEDAPRVGGFAIGLTLTAVILAIGPLTGASVNPARSFGPAVASGNFAGNLIYWLGPLLGGGAAALLYDGLFLRRGVEPVDHGPLEPV